MVQEVEGTHQVGDVTLFTKSWKPSDPPVAKLIFIHGFNDHMDRYYELFPTLASRGIQVDGFDQRGWGRSVQKESDKGLTGPTETVIADIVSFISARLPSSIPIFVMGHSMGGGEALTLASNPKHADLVGQIRGWILESPLIAFPKGHEPSTITVFLGRLARPILPRKQLQSALPAENLTRDPEVVRSLKTDALLHGLGTLEGLSGLIDRTNDLSSGKLKLNKTVKGIWLGHGTVDKATCYDGSKNWFNSQCQDINDKEFKSYDGWYHQLHADLPEDRPVFAKDVGDWIIKRVGREVKL